ncbi:esterase-like activity of phytase family protein [Thalassotalea euphylliae]|nr:esterase-like activity of phytase family protein [Thalassotalea euphylliae]
MSTNSFKVWKLMIAGSITSSLVIGCGSDSNDAEIAELKQPQYSLAQPKCLDSNLNGHCDIGEQEVTNDNIASIQSASPLVANYPEFTLTAPTGSSLVTPFTTLINNEVMFNPEVNGSIDRAKQYLTRKLGIDFSQLDTLDGPQEAADEIINSLKSAERQRAKQHNAYVAIAGATEQMVFANSFAVETSSEQLHKLYHSVSIKDVFVLATNQQNQQNSIAQFDLHPITGRIILATADNNLISLNANNGEYAAITQNQQTTQPLSNLVASRANITNGFNAFDGGDDDDDDYCDYRYQSSARANTSGFNAYDGGDDDDDDCDHINGGNSAPNIINIRQIKQHRNDNNFYLLTSQELASATELCQAQGEYGAFLSSVNSGVNSGASSATAAPQAKKRPAIDAYSGATGGPIEPQLPVPPIDQSDAACYNNGLIAMAVTPDSSTLVLANREQTGQTLYRVNGDTLQPTQDFAYALENFARVNQLTISNDGKLAGFTDVATGMLTLVDLDSMTTKATAKQADVQLQAVEFIGNDRLASAQLGTEKLFIYQVNNDELTLTDTVSIGHNIDSLSVNDNQFIAVADQQQISVVNFENNEFTISQQLTGLGPQIQKVAVLDNKVVYTNGQNTSSLQPSANQLNYVTFGGEMGSPLRVAQKLLTTGLVMAERIGADYWRTGNLTLPKDLTSYGIEGINITWSTNQPTHINLDTGQVSASLPANSVVSAEITGTFRYEPVTIVKEFNVF